MSKKNYYKKNKKIPQTIVFNNIIKDNQLQKKNENDGCTLNDREYEIELLKLVFPYSV